MNMILLFFIKVLLIYNVVLVSDIQHDDSGLFFFSDYILL